MHSFLEYSTKDKTSGSSGMFRRKTQNKITNLNSLLNLRRSRLVDWGIFHDFFSKTNMLETGLRGLSRTISQSLLCYRNDFRPFLSFLNFPKPLFTLPVWRTIAPEVKVNIKGGSNKSA
jgi:hypothetical protein